MRRVLVFDVNETLLDVQALEPLFVDIFGDGNARKEWFSTLIAAHAWDIVGAMRAGCAGAFVARPGAVWYPLAPPPDAVAPDLIAVAERIIALEILPT